MPIVNTDAVLWYNVEKFGQAGYAVPNYSDKMDTLNPTIYELVDLVGLNLFAIMHHEDADLSIPPSINTLMRIHKLYVRFGAITTGRAIPPGQVRMETNHVRPAAQVFKAYPCPYFNVRNPMMKEWAGWAFMCLSEMIQHTENRNEIEISTDFAGDIGQYLKRIYVRMAIEMFQKTKDVAEADGFKLVDADFKAYNPQDFYTSIEMVDTRPALNMVFTEDQLQVLRQGIPLTEIDAVVKPWPLNLTDLESSLHGDGPVTDGGMANQPAGGAGSANASAGGPVFPPPTGP